MAPPSKRQKRSSSNRRGSDEIFIEVFISSDKIDTLHEFSTDSNSLLESLKQIRIEGGQSAVIDALYLAAEYVAEHNKNCREPAEGSCNHH